MSPSPTTNIADLTSPTTTEPISSIPPNPDPTSLNQSTISNPMGPDTPTPVPVTQPAPQVSLDAAKLELENQSLKRRLVQYAATLEKLTGHARREIDASVRARDDALSAAADAAALRDRVADSEAALTDAEDARVGAESRAEELDRQVKELQADAEAAAHVSAERDAAAVELAALRQRTEQATSEATTLREERVKEEQHAAKLQTTVDDLNAKIEVARQTEDRLREAEAAREEAAAAKEAAEAKTKELASKEETIRSERDLFQLKVSDSDATVEQIRAELAAAEEKAKAAKAAAEAAAAQGSEKARLAEQRSSEAEDSVVALRGELDEVHKQLSETKNSLEEHREAAKNHQEQREAIEERDAMRFNLNALQDELEQSNDLLTRAAIDALSDKQRTRKLEDSLRKMRDNVGAEREQRQAKQQKVDVLTQELYLAERELDELRATKRSLSEECHKYQLQIHQKDTDAVNKTRELKELGVVRADRESKAQRLSLDLSNMKNSLAKKESDFVNISTEYSEVREQLKATAKELEDKHVDLTTARRDTVTYKERVADLQGEVERNKGVFADLQLARRQLQELTTQISNKDEELANLKAWYSTMKTESSEVMREKKRLSDMLADVSGDLKRANQELDLLRSMRKDQENLEARLTSMSESSARELDSMKKTQAEQAEALAKNTVEQYQAKLEHLQSSARTEIAASVTDQLRNDLMPHLMHVVDMKAKRIVHNLARHVESFAIEVGTDSELLSSSKPAETGAATGTSSRSASQFVDNTGSILPQHTNQATGSASESISIPRSTTHTSGPRDILSEYAEASFDTRAAENENVIEVIEDGPEPATDDEPQRLPRDLPTESVEDEKGDVDETIDATGGVYEAVVTSLGIDATDETLDVGADVTEDAGDVDETLDVTRESGDGDEMETGEVLVVLSPVETPVDSATDDPSEALDEATSDGPQFMSGMPPELDAGHGEEDDETENFGDQGVQSNREFEELPDKEEEQAPVSTEDIVKRADEKVADAEVEASEFIAAPVVDIISGAADKPEEKTDPVEVLAEVPAPQPEVTEARDIPKLAREDDAADDGADNMAVADDIPDVSARTADIVEDVAEYPVKAAEVVDAVADVPVAAAEVTDDVADIPSESREVSDVADSPAEAANDVDSVTDYPAKASEDVAGDIHAEAEDITVKASDVLAVADAADDVADDVPAEATDVADKTADIPIAEVADDVPDDIPAESTDVADKAVDIPVAAAEVADDVPDDVPAEATDVADKTVDIPVAAEEVADVVPVEVTDVVDKTVDIPAAAAEVADDVADDVPAEAADVADKTVDIPAAAAEVADDVPAEATDVADKTVDIPVAAADVAEDVAEDVPAEATDVVDKTADIPAAAAEDADDVAEDAPAEATDVVDKTVDIPTTAADVIDDVPDIAGEAGAVDIAADIPAQATEVVDDVVDIATEARDAVDDSADIPAEAREVGDIVDVPTEAVEAENIITDTTAEAEEAADDVVNIPAPVDKLKDIPADNIPVTVAGVIDEDANLLTKAAEPAKGVDYSPAEPEVFVEEVAQTVPVEDTETPAVNVEAYAAEDRVEDGADADDQPIKYAIIEESGDAEDEIVNASAGLEEEVVLGEGLLQKDPVEDDTAPHIEPVSGLDSTEVIAEGLPEVAGGDAASGEPASAVTDVVIEDELVDDVVRKEESAPDVPIAGDKDTLVVPGSGLDDSDIVREAISEDAAVGDDSAAPVEPVSSVEGSEIVEEKLLVDAPVADDSPAPVITPEPIAEPGIAAPVDPTM